MHVPLNHACLPDYTPSAMHAPSAMHTSQPHIPPNHAHTHAHPRTMHPPLDRMTDACKNITFSQLRWRVVNICVNLTNYKKYLYFLIDLYQIVI